MGRRVVVFDRFSGGEHGRLGPYKAPETTFTALNMLVYADGSLGVRPGLKDRTPTGLPVGKAWAFETTPVATKDGLIIIGAQPYAFNLLGAAPGAATAYTGALAAAPTRILDAAKAPTLLYLSSQGDRSYVVDPVALTVSALAGSPGGGAIAIYGERLMVGNQGTGQRVQYSEAANFASWPAANFFDVGDTFHVADLVAQRQHLLIAKQNGFHILTGVPGVDDVLRKVASFEGPVRAHQGALGRDDEYWFAPVLYPGPARFDGVRPRRLAHLNYTGGSSGGDNATDNSPADFGVVALGKGITGAGVLFVSGAGERAALFHNGVWTFHTFEVDVSGFVAADSNLAYLSDGGSATTSAKVYSFDYDKDSPGIEGSNHSRPGDASAVPVTAEVTFPEWWATDGSEVTVRAVVIDFLKYSTGASQTNHFDVIATTLRRYNNAGGLDAAVASFDEAGASSSASGTLHRAVLGLGDAAKGGGFRLRLANCRGVAIQRIEVIVETQEPRI